MYHDDDISTHSATSPSISGKPQAGDGSVDPMVHKQQNNIPLKPPPPPPSPVAAVPPPIAVALPPLPNMSPLPPLLPPPQLLPPPPQVEAEVVL